MKRIQLLPFGKIDDALLADLSADLARVFSVSSEILERAARPSSRVQS